jgi:rod shape-determining protein MreC
VFKFSRKNLISVVVFFLLLILLSSIIPTLRNPLLNILEYPLKLFTLLTREAKGIIFYHRNLIKYERFKKEIDLLKQRLNAANEVYLENKRLKNLLSFKQKSQFKVIAARVIARSPDSWSSIMIIDKGSHHGIKPGMVVISYLGLVGRVVENTEFTSKIMLINDSNLSVSCLVQRSRQEGLVSGTLGSSLIMKYLPKECDIKISDLIVTSGLSSSYPKGLIVGTVVDIAEEFSGLSRYAIIKPAVNLSDIEEALVIIQ